MYSSGAVGRLVTEKLVKTRHREYSSGEGGEGGAVLLVLGGLFPLWGNCPTGVVVQGAIFGGQLSRGQLS